LFDPTTKPGKSTKLTHRWVGPCTILQLKSDVLFVIEMADGKKKLVHKNRLRKHVTAGNGDGAYLSHEKDLLQEELDTIGRLQSDFLTKQQEKQAQLALVSARQATVAATPTLPPPTLLVDASVAATTTLLSSVSNDSGQNAKLSSVIVMGW